MTAGAVLFLLFTTPADAAGTQMLHGHVPAAVRRLHPMGRLVNTNRLHLAIGLPLRNRQSLNSLLQEIYGSASPNFHHYLTPEQFTEKFGPTEQDYQAVIAFAKANGLTVSGTHPNRMLVDVNGSVAGIEKALHVNLRVYQHPKEARTFYAPDVEPSLDLAVPVLHISGLDNFIVPRPMNFKMTPLSHPMAVTPVGGTGPGGSFMGNDFRAAYAPDVCLDGSGQTVGIMEFDGYYTNDIATYMALAELPNVSLTNVFIDGYDGSGGSNNLEVALDIEMAISMAPGLSSVIVYEAPNDTAYVGDILDRMAGDSQVKQLSSSWVIGDDPNYDQYYLLFALQGQSFFQASGDDGAYYPGIAQWADDPNITLVGGTTLITTAATKNARVLPTATSLPDGKVLVTGGTHNGSDALSDSELYDPATGLWTPTGALNTPRFCHTATLLPNGKVLVAGGTHNQTSAFSNSELYDPVAGTWTATGAMHSPRYGHTATLLPNGQVLVAGGTPDGSSALSNSELYDPVTGTWTVTGGLNTGRYDYTQTATLLPDGKVLVMGGVDGGNSAELYDPATGTWAPTNPMTTSRIMHTATLLPNGKVLVAGGTSDWVNPISNAELYDPATGTWTVTGSLQTPRFAHTMTLLASGKVLVAGGCASASLFSAEVYDPATGTWTATGSLNSARYYNTATLLTNGQVLIAGGWNGGAGAFNGAPLSNAELYYPASGIWTWTSPTGASGTWLSETVWNWGNGIASGGGISTNYSIPSWQQGINMTANQGSTTMRNIPDVALTADKIYVTYGNGASGAFGGTSAATPLWAGFAALINQQAMNNGEPPVGFINPAIYAIGNSTNYAACFHDIITGNNTSPGSPNLFLACPSYDLCTGWGTPSGQNLINALVGPPLTMPPAILSQPQSQTIQSGHAASFSVTASSSFPSGYQWLFNGMNIAGGNSRTLNLTGVQVEQSGNYAVLVTNAYGSILSSNAMLTITLDHFACDPIPSPRFVNTPFAVTIRAQNLTNGIFTNFIGTAILGTTNGIAVIPPVSGNFVQGVWTGAVVISQTVSNLVLQANDGFGDFGLANPINVINLPGLEMWHSGNIALILWPVGYSGFVLEASCSLSPAFWVPVSNPPIQIGDQYLVPLEMTGTNGFYRLRFSSP